MHGHKSLSWCQKMNSNEFEWSFVSLSFCRDADPHQSAFWWLSSSIDLKYDSRSDRDSCQCRRWGWKDTEGHQETCRKIAFQLIQYGKSNTRQVQRNYRKPFAISKHETQNPGYGIERQFWELYRWSNASELLRIWRLWGKQGRSSSFRRIQVSDTMRTERQGKR